MLIVPEVIWEYTAATVFTMQRMYGMPVGQVERMREAGIDIPTLARTGVEIFFTQVFTDGFFHADMHRATSTCPTGPRRWAAISRWTSASSARCPSSTRTTWRRISWPSSTAITAVAQLHIESGWVPPDTRELEGAVRAVCEPYFDRPLSEISLGQVLLRLFPNLAALQCRDPAAAGAAAEDAAQRRGLGRQLDPNLDLWKTAKPYLERWMRQRVGIRACARAWKRKRRSGRRCCRRCPGWSTTISTARTSRPPCWPKWSSCAGRKAEQPARRGPGRRDRAGCRVALWALTR